MKQKVLIVGAGVAGKELLKEIRKHKELDIDPLGFIDDDKKLIGKMLHGIPVLGDRGSLKSNIKKYGIDKVFIALPSVDGNVVGDILKICIEAGIPCQTIPRVREIIEGKVDIRTIREVMIEDLLERPVRKHDIADVSELLKGSIVMVTGAAGSIGSELCRQIASYKPKKIVMYDWWENGLYELGVEFKEYFPDIPIVLAIGSIQDKEHVEANLQKHTPSIIFHAAAYKHVPLMEDHVIEAVKNNIFGTYNLVETAKKTNVSKFVFISTDKAVNPKSIMGISKLIGEIIAVSLQPQSKTQFISVRFGNVLNSAGSVLPLFRKQLNLGEITVTDSKMTRFFMTIQEAVQLILKATVLGKGNEIFVLDMGKPIKIIDMAKKFILLSGLIPERDIKIKYIGTRPGEKLSEELTTVDEDVTKTKFDKIMVLEKKVIDAERLSVLLEQLKACCRMYDEEEAKLVLRKFALDFNGKTNTK